MFVINKKLELIGGVSSVLLRNKPSETKDCIMAISDTHGKNSPCKCQSKFKVGILSSIRLKLETIKCLEGVWCGVCVEGGSFCKEAGIFCLSVVCNFMKIGHIV